MLGIPVEEELHGPVLWIGGGQVDPPQGAVLVPDEDAVGYGSRAGRIGRRGARDRRVQVCQRDQPVRASLAARGVSESWRFVHVLAEAPDYLAAVQANDRQRAGTDMGGAVDAAVDRAVVVLVEVVAAYLAARLVPCLNRRDGGRGARAGATRRRPVPSGQDRHRDLRATEVDGGDQRRGGLLAKERRIVFIFGQLPQEGRT